jgi:hypothetical protein
MREFLPRDHVREMNSRVADWFLAHSEKMTSCDPVGTVEEWVAEGLNSESGVIINEDECAAWADEIVEDLTDGFYEIIHDGDSGEELLSNIGKASEAVLYNKDSPLRATLLCTLTNSYAFMPLNYVLAKLLSPEDAKLKILASNWYSVVIDEKRNIVFDNFWYFCGKPASVTLERSRDVPQSKTFDFSLGGLAK